jgi:hypothetical protein
MTKSYEISVVPSLVWSFQKEKETKMLTMEIIPGKSVGSFVLGMGISEAIGFIQQKNKVISHADLKYNEMVEQ